MAGRGSEYEPSDEFFFKDEVKSIFKKYHGDKNQKMSDADIDMIAKEVKKELNCFNYCSKNDGETKPVICSRAENILRSAYYRFLLFRIVRFYGRNILILTGGKTVESFESTVECSGVEIADHFGNLLYAVYV